MSYLATSKHIRLVATGQREGKSVLFFVQTMTYLRGNSRQYDLKKAMCGQKTATLSQDDPVAASDSLSLPGKTFMHSMKVKTIKIRGNTHKWVFLAENALILCK